MAVYGPIPCQVETVFLVFHHYALPFSTAVSSPFEILTVSLGVYSSLHAAQSVAVSALHLCLKQLQSIGISGKVSTSKVYLLATQAMVLNKILF